MAAPASRLKSANDCRPRGFTTCAALLLSLGMVPAAMAASQTYTCSGLSLTIDDRGAVISILDRATGVNRSRYSAGEWAAYFCRLLIEGSETSPTAVTFAEDHWEYTFGQAPGAPVANVRIEARPDYLLVTLDSITVETGFDEVRFAELQPLNGIDHTAYRFLEFEDDGRRRYLVIYALDIATLTSVGAGEAGYMIAQARPNLPAPGGPGIAGRKVALFACDADPASVYAALDKVETDNDLPRGAAGKTNAAVHHAGIFWIDVDAENCQEALDYTREAGAGRIMLYTPSWQSHLKRSEVADGWGSRSALVSWIDQCHAEGIVVGAHLFPTRLYIGPECEYVEDGCDIALYHDRTTTLAADLPADQIDGLIETTTTTADWPTAPDQREILIGRELIEYSGVRTSAPYGFTGPFVRAKYQPSSDGLGPQAHSAGTDIGHLVKTGPNRYWVDIERGGLAEVCTNQAALLDTLNFDYVYTDGLEHPQEPSWFATAVQPHILWQKLTRKPDWFEVSSNSAAGLQWTMIGSDGQIDYLPQDGAPLKNEVDRNVTSIERREKQLAFIQPQIGWVQISRPLTPQTTPDELEYALVKCIAHEMPPIFETWLSTFRTWPLRDENLHLISRYEALRLAGHFDEHVRKTVAHPGKDFMLFTDGAGTDHLLPVARVHVADAAGRVTVYLSEDRAQGNRFATLWPRASGDTPQVILDGVNVTDLRATNYRGNPLNVADLGHGQVAVTVDTRIYLELLNVPHAEDVFNRAAVLAGD